MLCQACGRCCAGLTYCLFKTSGKLEIGLSLVAGYYFLSSGLVHEFSDLDAVFCCMKCVYLPCYLPVDSNISVTTFTKLPHMKASSQMFSCQPLGNRETCHPVVSQHKLVNSLFHHHLAI